jgi:two-component system, NtrC family, sensor kinase
MYDKALEVFKRLSDPYRIATADSLLSSIYNDQNNGDSSFAYLKLATALKDSLHAVKINRLNEFQNIGFEEQIRLKELEDEKIQTQTKIRTYAMMAGIGVFMLITLLLYRNSRNRKKANELLQNQKEKVESTLQELKSTQSQLIQSEKDGLAWGTHSRHCT